MVLLDDEEPILMPYLVLFISKFHVRTQQSEDQRVIPHSPLSVIALFATVEEPEEYR